jgi:hypothetical protein
MVVWLADFLVTHIRFAINYSGNCPKADVVPAGLSTNFGGPRQALQSKHQQSQLPRSLAVTEVFFRGWLAEGKKRMEIYGFCDNLRLQDQKHTERYTNAQSSYNRLEQKV